MLLTHPAWWLMAIASPLLAALLLAWPAARAGVLRLAPWTAIPALALALVAAPGSRAELPWLLLGARVGLDETGRVFLLLSAALWTAAGVYARGYLARDPAEYRFFAFFLLTMSGNVGLVVAGDLVTFYLCFALMGFAAYGVIVHTGDADALRAGKVYIVLVVAGEVLLFAGVLAVAAIGESTDLGVAPARLADSPWRNTVAGLLLAGFGIKAGALPLHVWLPLAHPAAPTPASAVLSGAMIKAGLLGWLRFLPLGAVALPEWGAVCLLAGLAALFGGVVAGLAQQHPKVALAYSSISQMGFMLSGVAAGLLAPEAWPILLPAVLLYALHHGLAKGALFLAVGMAAAPARALWKRRFFLIGLVLPAMALAGVPLTSGAVSKTALKQALDPVRLPIPGITLLLSLAAIGTTLLMAHVLTIVLRPTDGHARADGRMWVSWISLVAAGSVVIWILPWFPGEATAASRTPISLWSTLWPPLFGVGVWAWWRAHPGVAPGRRLHIPPGDVLEVVIRWWRVVDRASGRWRLASPIGLVGDVSASVRRWIDATLTPWLTRAEQQLEAWRVAGMLLLGTALVFGLLLAR